MCTHGLCTLLKQGKPCKLTSGRQSRRRCTRRAAGAVVEVVEQLLLTCAARRWRSQSEPGGSARWATPRACEAARASKG